MVLMYTNPHRNNILATLSKRLIQRLLNDNVARFTINAARIAIHVDKMHAVLMFHAVMILPFLLGISLVFTRAIESNILRRYCAFGLLTHSPSRLHSTFC